MSDPYGDFDFDEHGIYREKGSHGSGDQGELRIYIYTVHSGRSMYHHVNNFNYYYTIICTLYTL